MSNSYGPSSSAIQDYHNPPVLKPGQDRKKWRRAVDDWVRFTKVRADAGDKYSKANMTTMGYMLYQALHVDYKKVVDHAVEGGQLTMMGAQDQDEVVKAIVTLVGEDTPIHITNRILLAYQNLHKCIRRKNETPSKFADRFRALASEYMALAGMDATGKDSQLLAMVLLQNCNLDESTFNSLTIQLVGNAERRMQEEARRPSTISVTRNNLEVLQRQVQDLQKKLQESLQPVTGDAGAAHQASATAVGSIKAGAQSIFSAIDRALTPSADTSSSDSKNPEIFLDDVHKALSSLDAPSSQPSKNDAQQIAELTKRVGNLSSMLGQMKKRARNSLSQLSGINKSKQRRDERMKKIKARTKCKACGMQGHWVGDPECRLSKQDDDTGDDGKDGTTSAAVPSPVFPHGGQ